MGNVCIKTNSTQKHYPQNIGYIQPNGIINFQTAETAETYAKNRVLDALKSLNPFERGIGLKGTQILGEANGDGFNISAEAASNILSQEGAEIIHKFWQKFAKCTGNFEYSTNFSNLMK